MSKLLFIFVFIVICSLSFAGENGGYAGSYLRMGLGAKSISLGNTGVAQPVTAYSAFYNPAVFSEIEGRFVGLSYSFLSLDRRFGFISFSMKVPPEAGFSIGWIESGVGDLVSYNSIGQETGDINHSANAIYFSFGRKIFQNLSIGVSLKILFEYINDGSDEFDYSSNGVGFDVGFLYELREDLRIGYQIRDLNSKLKANTDKIFERGGTTIDRFPVINKAGVHYIFPFTWLRGTYEFEWSNKSAYKHHFGFEALRGENLALRLGLNGNDLTYGAGMDFKILNIGSYLDYAFIPSIIDEGSSHIFSWQLAF